MPEEPNGHGSPSRLDRIEGAIEALAGGHEQLLTLQTELLKSQIRMINALKKLTREDGLP